jgi:hypothetical protein
VCVCMHICMYVCNHVTSYTFAYGLANNGAEVRKTLSQHKPEVTLHDMTPTALQVRLLVRR